LIQGGKSFNRTCRKLFLLIKEVAPKGGDIPAFDLNGMMGAGGGQITPE